MSKAMKRALVLFMVLSMLVGLLSGCGKKKQNEDNKEGETTTQAAKGEPTIIKIATHSLGEMDPNWKDPVTGVNNVMTPANQQAAWKAAETLKDKLNVQFKYVKYPVNVTQDLLKSVLANDPIADIARMWNGAVETVLAQNILQQIDDYADIFSDPDVSWMMSDKVFGHNYLLNCNVDFLVDAPLVYNITYLQKVDSLKENGKVVLPTTLWKQGEWTWSKFEEYLTKTKAYYANKKAPVRNEITIAPYNTNYRYTVMSSILTGGGNLYANDKVGVDSAQTKQGVAFIEKLMSKELMTSVPNLNNNTMADCFKNGETVFSDLPYWLMNKTSAGLVSRGEAMGIVPFPRPDDMSKDDKMYRQTQDIVGLIGIPKGLTKETTELSLKSFKLYFAEYYKNMAGGEKALDYFKRDNAKSAATLAGIDVTNSEYGEEMLDAYLAYNPTYRANEFSSITGWKGPWSTLIKESLFALNGASNYSTSIDSQKDLYYSKTEEMKSILSSDKIVDNIPPAITLVGKDIAVAKGTDAAKIDWSKYIAASDNLDGAIDAKNITVDVSTVKFDTVGQYDKGFIASVKDKEGNEKKAIFNLRVYDPDNKTAPTITAKETYRNVKKDEDASKISWAKDFVEAATSAEGFDIKAYITADISTLDVTKSGKYDVTLTVTDYAGNKAEQKISVTVADK